MVLLLGMPFGCTTNNGPTRMGFACGSIILPPGYTLQADRNRDTPVATGTLVNRNSGLRIGFSCGSAFGMPTQVFAEPAELESRHYTVVWSKSSGTGPARRITTFAEDKKLKQKKLYISYPNGPTNFVATVTSESEADEIERIIAGFTPVTP